MLLKLLPKSRHPDIVHALRTDNRIPITLYVKRATKHMAGDPKNLVQSAAKVFAVLRAFDANAPELTITEVAGRAGLDRGTAFRLIHTLKELGYLVAVPGSRRFRLTLKCLELGYTALARGDLKTHARPLLKPLVPDIADAASLGMLDGPEVVYVERVQGNLARGDMDRRIGSRTGAYASALGHAMLAYLPRHEQITALQASERVKLSERTLVDLDALLERLALVREQRLCRRRRRKRLWLAHRSGARARSPAHPGRQRQPHYPHRALGPEHFPRDRRPGNPTSGSRTEPGHTPLLRSYHAIWPSA